MIGIARLRWCVWCLAAAILALAPGAAIAELSSSAAQSGTASLSAGAPPGGLLSDSQLPDGLAPAVRQATGTAGAGPVALPESANQQELQASDGAPVNGFGFSVSLSDSGRVALIGARQKDSDKGAAYVFVREGGRWIEQQELQAPDGALLHQFGWSVSLSDSGRVALIGARGKDGYKGAAYVFVREGGSWTEQQELQAPEGAPGDEFGSSVSLSDSGGVALIGARGKDGYKGAAYVFVRQGGSWTEQQELQASDGVPSDEFGDSVSLSGSGRVALVGAPRKDFDKGAAYVFDGDLERR